MLKLTLGVVSTFRENQSEIFETGLNLKISGGKS